jgi:hypothetical protein
VSSPLSAECLTFFLFIRLWVSVFTSMIFVNHINIILGTLFDNIYFALFFSDDWKQFPWWWRWRGHVLTACTLFCLWATSCSHNNCPIILTWPFLCFYVFFQNLIDLAGSESSKTETTGLRRREGSYINKSLLTLGTVSFHRQFPIKCWILI